MMMLGEPLELSILTNPVREYCPSSNTSNSTNSIMGCYSFFKEHGINWRGEKENEYLAYKNGKGKG